MAKVVVKSVRCDVCGGEMGSCGGGLGYDFCEECETLVHRVTDKLMEHEGATPKAVAALYRREAARLAPPVPRKRKG